MADTVRNHDVRTEFWRPPIEDIYGTNRSAAATEVFACPRCDSEFVMGSRYCHVCGFEREADPTVSKRDWLASVRGLKLDWINRGLGLNLGAAIAFAIGVACLIAALLVTVIYQAQTVLDWQAVQIWRVQWLLAGIAAFVAGVLLKRPPATERE